MSLLDMNRMSGEMEEGMAGGFGTAAFDVLGDVLDSVEEGVLEDALDDALFMALDEGDDEADDDEDDAGDADDKAATSMPKAAPLMATQAALETALEAVSQAATEHSLEGRIEAYLSAQKGESITNWALAKEFGITTRRCVKALKRLMRRNRVRVVMVAGRRQYYVPTAEQWQKLNELREAKMRSTGEYKLPQPMVDVWNRIRAERAGVPSYYGGAV